MSNNSNLECVAERYVSDVLRSHTGDSFVLFNYSGKIYAGRSELLFRFNDCSLVRVIKIQQPLPKYLVDLLVKRANPTEILSLDESILIKERGLFYASLHDCKLSPLNPEEYKSLLTRGLFE